MAAVRAFLAGFRWDRRTLIGAAGLYLTALLFSTLALHPLQRGLHEDFDRAPEASRLAREESIALMMEVRRTSPSLVPSAFRGLMGYGLLQVPVTLLLLAGVYGTAVPSVLRQRRDFWKEARGHFPSFLGIAVLNLPVLAGVVGAGGLAVALGERLIEGRPDPRAGAGLFWLAIFLAAVLGTLWRNSVGYGRAYRVMTLGETSVLRCALEGLWFSVRRLLPVNLLAWSVHLLRGAAVAFLFFVLDYDRTGDLRLWREGLGIQAFFMALACLRVVEARIHVAYLNAFLK